MAALGEPLFGVGLGVLASLPEMRQQLLDVRRHRRTQAALDRLGEPCRKLLLLYYWEEQSMESIASLMGMANADTVKSRKYQCKKALEALVRERLPRYD
jgi:DNA-directed RNA polymerase specialized sigma24 family protein